MIRKPFRVLVSLLIFGTSFAAFQNGFAQQQPENSPAANPLLHETLRGSRGHLGSSGNQQHPKPEV